MRTMMILFLAMATACATDTPDATSTADQAMMCDPNCDPGNFQYLVSQVVGAAWGLGQQVAGSMSCWHYAAGCFPSGCEPASDECSAIYQDPWGQQYLVDCSSLTGCDHVACGWPNTSQPQCRG